MSVRNAWRAALLTAVAAASVLVLTVPRWKSAQQHANAAPSVESDRGESKLENAAFGAGCFWGVQAAFDQMKGVVSSEVGYMGGHTKNPTYKEVCTDRTGYAEVVRLEFDPSVVSYRKLVDFFWRIHDPTTNNRQGPDFGSQYRSVIFFYLPEQKQIAEASKEEVDKSGKFRRPIVTEIVPATDFYRAEDYHQKYYKTHNIQCHAVSDE
ncbi:MAG: peptide-methionine (S)-S-oxide reductase [Armatimonadetes bacterium CG07_land_8_20_14_0_80_59_28]|nr:MAG: peptide-methionine (S)-S-oxide reductase [Armatimonadetes bacterium CG07_land_8_20_14_0_80_59_28]